MRGDKMKMRIKDFARLCGVSVRTLHYYDEIGLLSPSYVDDCSGYRFYDESSLLRMQEILFYRELDFSLKSINEILSSPNYNKEKALEKQKKLLILKKERLERLISAIDFSVKGENVMSFFDNSEFEKYKTEAKEKWGNTAAYDEYSEKSKDYSKEKYFSLAEGMDEIMKKFASCMKNDTDVNSAEVQNLVEKLQSYITENYYTCTKEILFGLGQMYVFDERFKGNIDKHAHGTAEYINKAIKIYCR